MPPRHPAETLPSAARALLFRGRHGGRGESPVSHSTRTSKPGKKTSSSEEAKFCPLFIPLTGKHTLLAIMVDGQSLDRLIISTGVGFVAGAGASWWLASNGFLNYAGHGILWSTCLLVYGSNAGFTWPKILAPPESVAFEDVFCAGLSATAAIAAAAAGQFCLVSLGFL